MSERKTRGSGREIKLTEGLEHNLVPKGKGLGTTLLEQVLPVNQS